VIQCTASLPDGAEIGRLWVYSSPRTGERLLLAGDTGDAAEARYGTRRFAVLEVEHHLAESVSDVIAVRTAEHVVGLVVEPA